MEKTLSIFVDESGDFGKYTLTSQYYIVALVFHEQCNSISKQVKCLNNDIKELGFKYHAIHSAPLIRREANYYHLDVNSRKKIFNKLFNFTRHVNIKYASLIVDKKQSSTSIEITSNLSKQLSQLIRENLEYFSQFENIIIYYDNGQYQITNILVAVFNTLWENNFEMRQVAPIDYKLFQTADLICTLTLLKQKIKDDKKLTKSESIFFGSVGKLRKTYLKYLNKIKL